MAYSVIHIDTWKRKEIFSFFSQFEEPFFGLVANVDVSIAKTICKKKAVSFFIYYLHKSILAINKIEAYRMRIVEGEVRIYDQIHASATIARDDETFGFSHIEYAEDFSEFLSNATHEIESVRKSNSLFSRADEPNTVHYSSIPWVKFTGLTHARKFSGSDSCTKISFGKLYLDEKKWMMPVSIHSHHALSDGYHAGKYFDLFQELLNGG